MKKIPIPMTVAKEDSMVWTKLAVSVLQEHKRVRPMDLEDLFHGIRELGAMSYLGTRTTVHNQYRLLLAQCKAVHATSGSGSRELLQQILRTPPVFDRSRFRVQVAVTSIPSNEQKNSIKDADTL
jgi:hypothetical protein